MLSGRGLSVVSAVCCQVEIGIESFMLSVLLLGVL
jgi:hypothetical protein